MARVWQDCSSSVAFLFPGHDLPSVTLEEETELGFGSGSKDGYVGRVSFHVAGRSCMECASQFISYLNVMTKCVHGRHFPLS